MEQFVINDYPPERVAHDAVEDISEMVLKFNLTEAEKLTMLAAYAIAAKYAGVEQ